MEQVVLSDEINYSNLTKLVVSQVEQLVSWLVTHCLNCETMAHTLGILSRRTKNGVGESIALTFLLFSHTYLSSLRCFIHRHFGDFGERVRDECEKKRFFDSEEGVNKRYPFPKVISNIV